MRITRDNIHFAHEHTDTLTHSYTNRCNSLSHSYLFILPGCQFVSQLHVRLTRLSVCLTVTCSSYQAISLSHSYMFILPGCQFVAQLHFHLNRLSVCLTVACSTYQAVSLSHSYMFMLPCYQFDQQLHIHKLISLIRNGYEDMACRVIHAGQLTDSFMVKTGVRQGCLLSPFLFLLAPDWIMKKTTKYRRNGIQWTPWRQLEDLDFADDLALLSHSHQQMQEKNRATKHSVNTARTQHQQKQDKDYESQHKEQQPHYNERRATGRDILIHIPVQCNQQTWRHRRRRQSKDTESKSCIHHVEKNLESKTNQN